MRLAIVARLMFAGVLPIYFILKKVSGSKTTFAEDLKEYLTARPQPQPETLELLSTLDSGESIILQVYKYVLIIGLILGSDFIVWFFIATQNDAERNFLRLYFGSAYLFLVFCVVGSFVAIKRQQCKTRPRILRVDDDDVHYGRVRDGNVLRCPIPLRDFKDERRMRLAL